MVVSGHCYCRARRFTVASRPLGTAYCHCEDCRRWTGAPVAAFAAFRAGAVRFSPGFTAPTYTAKGVERWNCPDCGSPLLAAFDYLPDQVYVPLGVVDQADELSPQIHCHDESRLGWLNLDDTLPRKPGSGRDVLHNFAEPKA